MKGKKDFWLEFTHKIYNTHLLDLQASTYYGLALPSWEKLHPVIKQQIATEVKKVTLISVGSVMPPNQDI